MTRRFRAPRVWAAVVTALVCGCQDNGVEPMLRFGQSGQLTVDVVTPRRFLLSPVRGELRQVLTWRSTGAWQLQESIAYRDRVGSETTTRSPGLPVAFATGYATLIAQINGGAGLNLFIDDLDPDLDPHCDAEQEEARVTLRIQDEIRGQERSWTRCSQGPLGSLSPAGSGPDPHASRVIQVSRFAHDRTLGDSATSVYHVSIPFATLDKGAKPGELIMAPQVFLGGPGAADAPAGWMPFWEWHAAGSPSPAVDWSADMVVVAFDGARYEAGSTVEIREILPIRNGAIVQLVEFVPGDFCSPAAVEQTPFHIVVAPRTQSNIQFSDVARERVPCGL